MDKLRLDRVEKKVDRILELLEGKGSSTSFVGDFNLSAFKKVNKEYGSLNADYIKL